MDSTLLRHRMVCSATARHLFLLWMLMNSACCLVDLLQMKLLLIFFWLVLHVQAGRQHGSLVTVEPRYIEFDGTTGICSMYPKFDIHV